MKILAIDTATKFLCLAIYNDTAIYEYNLEVGPKLSNLLAITIKRLLTALEVKPADFDYFICGIGPGSFTGMRVGLSTAKGLSWALAKPLIGISTLDTIAMNLAPSNNIIIPIVDAKRGLIYTCFYRNTKNGLRRLSGYMLVSKEELLKKIKLIKSPVVILGDALNLYRDALLEKIPNALLLDKDDWYPKAHNIIKLAQARIKKRKLDDLSKVNPIYVYPKECQVKR